MNYCSIFVVQIKITMIKNKDILVRIDYELKKQLQEKAKFFGLSLSSYVRMLIVKDLNSQS